jgi:hypothetical protein
MGLCWEYGIDVSVVIMMGCLGDMGIHGSRRDFTEELVKHPHKLVLRSSHSRDDADVFIIYGYGVLRTGPFFFTLKKEYSEIQSGGTGRDADVNENIKTFFRVI